MLALVPCPPSLGTSLEAQMVNQPALQETRGWCWWQRPCLPEQESRNTGLIPELERCPAGGHGNSLQCFCLGNQKEEPGRL